MTRFRLILSLILALAACCPCLSWAGAPEPTGFYLVSIGCGDPDNITVKAMKTIKKSDVIFCSDEMKAAWPDLFKGKECLQRPPIAIHKYFRAKASGFSQGSPDQDRKAAKAQKALKVFVDTVTRAVESGKTVCLLDHGDPGIYGPYIWTVDLLRDFNPQVIPGVSSFNAANAALGRGVTFGRAAKSVILTNGADLRNGYKGTDTLDRMTATGSAMVVFTMFTEFETLIEQVSRRYPKQTPVALVIKAGYDKDQDVVKGTLADIVDKVRAYGDVPFEHLVYIGDFMAE